MSYSFVKVLHAKATDKTLKDNVAKSRNDFEANIALRRWINFVLAKENWSGFNNEFLAYITKTLHNIAYKEFHPSPSIEVRDMAKYAILVFLKKSNAAQAALVSRSKGAR
jgi:hypothetical protein